MNKTLERVTSADGTSIAIERQGDGPPIVLVCGGSVDRGALAGVATILAEHFSVLNFDRRGRGDSGDTLPYAVEREIEDIEAVIAAAGGSAGLFGSSSGAALALTATAAGASVTKLALWEAPYILDPAARPPADQVQQYETMVAEGRRSDAAEYFMSQVVRMPPEFVAVAKTRAMVGVPGGPGSHARLRRTDHGRLLRAGRDGGARDRADAGPRRLGEHAVHGLDRRGARRCAAQRPRGARSRTRATTSMPRSWRRCWRSSSGADAPRRPLSSLARRIRSRSTVGA